MQIKIILNVISLYSIYIYFLGLCPKNSISFCADTCSTIITALFTIAKKHK